MNQSEVFFFFYYFFHAHTCIIIVSFLVTKSIAEFVGLNHKMLRKVLLIDLTIGLGFVQSKIETLHYNALLFQHACLEPLFEYKLDSNRKEWGVTDSDLTPKGKEIGAELFALEFAYYGNVEMTGSNCDNQVVWRDADTEGMYT